MGCGCYHHLRLHGCPIANRIIVCVAEDSGLEATSMACADSLPLPPLIHERSDAT